MRFGEHLEHAASKASREDKPGLVVQGGGLRGVYSIGALAALEECKLTDAFSLVMGSSAGAVNGAYFLAGQAIEGIDIYVEDLSNSNFVSLRRPWKIVDIDYLVDVALKEKHPLNVAALQGSETPLYTVLTDAETAEERIVSSRDEDLDPYEVIRATAALPGLYNKRVPLAERAYIDGGIANQVPVQEAFSRGAREVLVVLTRGRGYRRNGHGVAFRLASRALARGQSTAVKARLGIADPTYNQAMGLLEDEKADGARRRTWTVWPSDLDVLVERTTADRSKLRACAKMAREDMLRLLDEPYMGQL